KKGLAYMLLVVVQVTDQNDCTPEFLHAIYSRDGVPESVPAGTSLLQGIIKLRRSPPPRLRGPQYTLNITATDDNASGGPFPLSSSAQVIVGINDVNNNKPVFLEVRGPRGRAPGVGPQGPLPLLHLRLFPQCHNYSQRAVVLENQPPGTGVLRVQAQDADLGVNGQVKYGIMHRDGVSSGFHIDPDAGYITTTVSFDRERQREFTLSVTATDQADEPLIGICQITVLVADQNDNEPKFENSRYQSTQEATPPAAEPDQESGGVRVKNGSKGDAGGIKEEANPSPGWRKTSCVKTLQWELVSCERRHTMTTRAATRPSATPCPIRSRRTCTSTPAPAGSTSASPSHRCEPGAAGQAAPPPPHLMAISSSSTSSPHGLFVLRSSLTVCPSSPGPPSPCLRLCSSTTTPCPIRSRRTCTSTPAPAGSTSASPSHRCEPGAAGQPHACSSSSAASCRSSAQTSRIVRQIVASDGGNRSSSVELTVFITNVHNQPPQWDQPEYWVTVPENTVRDAKIVTIKATSPLGDPRVTYDLEEGQVPETNMPVRFYVKPNRADGSASILVAENLDFETTGFFTLRVRVQNVASVPLASFTTVYVNVTDVNDNVPFFLSSTYEATVPEGAQTGTSVAQVSAADLDSGPHGTVRYLILRDDSGDWRFFDIDSLSGAIVSRASFDREQKASYLLESLYEVSVEEDKEVGFVIITVTANDEDEGANAKLRYQIAAGNSMGAFDVEPEVGTIFVARPLDYEAERRYQLRLVASDGKWENETLVVVEVLNRNDEAPVFSQSQYHAAVTEELSQLPVLILQVSATDPDQEADQGALRYSLHGQGAGGEFTVDQRSGSIYAHRRLDREERPTWRFLVLATDEGGAGLTGFADVLLEVRDVNDNAPFFPCPALQAEGCFVGRVAENSPADTSVMEMRATDLDDPNVGANAILTYSIIQNVRNQINLNLFSINGATGTIYTVLRSLDREEAERHLVVVEARDGEGLAGTGTATIIVSDVNDHAPVFTQRLYSAQVTEDLEVGSQVLVVSAMDQDEGQNAAVTFSIVGGDEDRKFFLETDRVNRRGVIRLQKKVDFEKPQERVFNLTVKAEDSDFFSLSSCLVRVEDANDHAPVFSPQFYEAAALSEDTAAGTIVTQVTASDADSGQNGRLSYSISRQSDPLGQFLVDQSGWVLLAGSLDREKTSQHRILLLATDAGTPALTGTAVLIVTVLDVNDNGPEFEAAYRPMPLLPPRLTLPLSSPPDRLFSRHGARTGGLPGPGRLEPEGVPLGGKSPQLEAMLGVAISQVGVDDCPSTDCSRAGGCSSDVSFSQSPVALGAGEVSLVSLSASLAARCGCRSREAVRMPCAAYAANPCLNGGSCLDGPLGHRSWPSRRTGCCCTTDRLGSAHPGEPQDFVAIELKDGVPVLSVDHGSGTLTLQLRPAASLADRRWHRLDVSSDGKAVDFVLDQCDGATVDEREAAASSRVDESSCRAAGETPGDQSGCIRNLVVDSQVYDLASPGESVDSWAGCRLTDGACVSGAGPSCGPRGSCVADWGSFSCHCGPGYAGLKCDAAVPEFSFGSGSLLRLGLRGGGSSRHTSVQLLVRTRAPSGTLLAASSPSAREYVVLEVSEGHLSVRADLGDGAHALRLTAHRLDMGQWVLVSLRRHDNLFTLQLEQGGASREVQARLGSHRKMVVDPGSVTVGNGPQAANASRLSGVPAGRSLQRSAPPVGRPGPGPGGGAGEAGHRGGLPERRLQRWALQQPAALRGPLEEAPVQVTLTDASGQQSCRPSPCGPASCHNGGVCQATSADSFRCRCQEGFRGQRCELGQVRGQQLAALSPSSILAVSMCLLLFLAVLVAVTVWNQKGSRSKFRKRGVYHIPAEQQSWEDVRENILNYNEEGGGEQDQGFQGAAHLSPLIQRGYDITELKRPLCSSLSQSSSCTTAPLIKSSPGSQEDVHPPGSSGGCPAPYLSVQPPGAYADHAAAHARFQTYVSRIVWEADHDCQAFPPDSYHVWCVEGSGSPAGSLSSLGSVASRSNGPHGEEEEEEGPVRQRLSDWGPKFQVLSDMYERPRRARTCPTAADVQRSHQLLPQQR
uniref:Si:dkey-22o22.2 n=1 Tax=Tetraodon nigroviridis TaxID=99883 RepID=H3D609_TETNG